MTRALISALAVLLGTGLLMGCDPIVDAVPASDQGSIRATTAPAATPTAVPSVTATQTTAPFDTVPSATATQTTALPPAPPVSPTPTPAPQPDALYRVTGVIDGDTIDVRIGDSEARIRVIGIDTPERDECGYQEAASAMQSLVQSRDVRLEADPTQDDVDQYGRLLRHVFTADGVSVAESIIAKGLGHEYTYSTPYTHRDGHVAAQSAAKESGLGLWGAICGTSDEVGEQPVASAACPIKGNINRKGVRIYHLPGQQHYDETIIDEVKGERWFCSEQEAVEAGWRKSKR